ncbi:MAG: chorismate synthase [Chthonomonas sp.]|nr:chorismate synthase [Chthonomonas sp.]
MNTFGHLFRATTFGESHGGGVGVVIDGCPAQIALDVEAVQRDLDRRRPGQSHIVTQRKESDQVEVLSGVLDGKTLGTPIAMLVRNTDHRSGDYDEMATKYRPSHADFAYDQKYGIRAVAGGGRSSARETIGRVAAAAVAKLVLRQWFGVEVLAYVQRIHSLETAIDPLSVTLEQIEATPVRCPDPQMAASMIAHIEEIRKAGNSVGGVIQGVAHGVPAGWGEPVFGKLEAELARAVMSLPACKGFESGSGFAGTWQTGLEHNDHFVADNGHVTTSSNNSGGIQGGISNGMPILIQAAFKPTATVLRPQPTVTTAGENTELTGRGRHDPCVLPRAVPMVEAMMALVLVDAALQQKARSSTGTA